MSETTRLRLVALGLTLQNGGVGLGLWAVVWGEVADPSWGPLILGYLSALVEMGGTALWCWVPPASGARLLAWLCQAVVMTNFVIAMWFGPGEYLGWLVYPGALLLVQLIFLRRLIGYCHPRAGVNGVFAVRSWWGAVVCLALVSGCIWALGNHGGWVTVVLIVLATAAYSNVLLAARRAALACAHDATQDRV